MKPDSPERDRLLKFCSRLPGLPSDKAVARAEVGFALACFGQRTESVQGELRRGGLDSSGLAMLRCEALALESACRVVKEIWVRRFGEDLSPS